MLKLLKFGVGLNATLLMGGYLNSERKLNYELNREDLNKSFNFSEFKSKLEEFNKSQNVNNKKVNREDQIQNLQKEKFDILIIGGGCSGAGVILEADRRGYRTALIEMDDFASKTSSRSTKLIHGGIRYLQDAFIPGSGAHIEKLKLVFEALQERDFMINSAPYMNNIVEIKIPYKNIFQMNYYFMGLIMYQFLYAVHNIPNLVNTFPWPRLYLFQKRLSFFEGQMFDARQNLLSITSTKNSNYANYTKYLDYLYDEKTGKIIGVKAIDLLTNKEFEIHSDCVVNCTGIFADSNFNKEDNLKGKLITASKGAHLVVKKDLFKNLNIDAGFMIPETSDKRILFILPYQKEYFVIGTTDNEREKADQIEVEESDVDYILKEMKNSLNLSHEELDLNLKSQWAGLRPLVRNSSGNHSSKSLARNHVIRVDDSTGLVSLLGGKWTIYRKMGEDVIKTIENNKLVNVKQYSLDNINLKLSGAQHFMNLDNSLSYSEERKFYSALENYLIQNYSITFKLAESLVFKYGLNSIKVLEIDKEIIPEERFLLNSDNIILKAELLYSMNYEMTIKPNDFICRRTGLAFVDLKEAEGLIEKAANVMGEELKWSSDHLIKEIEIAKVNMKYLI